MPTSDPITILLTQDRWATANILQASKDLTHDQLHQPFEMGPGSLHNTLTHTLGGHEAWTQVLLEQEPYDSKLEETAPHTIDQLIEAHTRIADAFEAVIKVHPLDTIVTPSRQGRAYTFTRGGILTHVTTHAMHHRAHCLNMLRHLGVDPLPPNSVVEWMIMADT